jgi:hypothetical protein
VVLFDHVIEASHREGSFLLQIEHLVLSGRNEVLGMIWVPSLTVFHIQVLILHVPEAIVLAEYTGTASYFGVQGFLSLWRVNGLMHNLDHPYFETSV